MAMSKKCQVCEATSFLRNDGRTIEELPNKDNFSDKAALIVGHSRAPFAAALEKTTFSIADLADRPSALN
jgi:hypothetical protein